MSYPARVVQSAGFVDAENSRRFRIVTEPADMQARGTVVYVHPFAEEMNKSRRMAARMARLLAADGWRVVQRDLAGCGDSSGDFEQACWADWVHDVAAELRDAPSQRPLWLWGLRAGALLAAAALDARRPCHLLLWQPVTSGAQHLQQFLRLEAGARIAGTASESRAGSPLQQLRAGQAVEIAGYRLAPALALGLEGARFDIAPSAVGRIVWLELTQIEPAELSPASNRTISALVDRGLAVQAEALPGPPFWQAQEIEDCDALLERTRALLAQAPLPDAPGGAVAARAAAESGTT